METLCRVCIKKAAKYASLNSTIENSSNLSFLDLLNKCTTLNARESDSLPQNLCSVCANAMKTFYSFMKLAEKSDFILREALKKYNGHGEILCEEIAIRNEKIEEESEDFHQGDAFHCQPSKNSLLYILDIVKEEPRVCESTSSVTGFNENENFESRLNHPERSIEEPDDVLSHRLASTYREHADAEDDVPISLLKRRLIKIEDESDSQGDSMSLSFEQKCGDITIRNEKIVRGCEICGKTFTLKHNLKMHMGNHNGIRHKCDQCGKEFKHINTLRRHTNWHTNPKPFKCEICGKLLCSRKDHIRHIDICKRRSIEQQVKKPKIECGICGKNFSRKDYLEVHMENHMGITTRCNQCGKEFEHRYSLSRHMKWHNNPRPFNCEYCGKSLARKPSYDKHMKICKHQQTTAIEDSTFTDS